MPDSDSPFVVDVFSDIVCPWCYVGERRLDRALDAFRTAHPDLNVEVRWRPFQLQPDMPEGGLPWRAFAEQKFGGWERAVASFRYVERAARTDHIDFRFEEIRRAANTTDAHRLILFAETRGRMMEVASALFRAYFTEGRDLNDPEALTDVADGEGLDRKKVRAFLASELGRAEVAASQETAEQMGVTGVPFYIIDRRFALTGAQPETAFREVLNTAIDPEQERE